MGLIFKTLSADGMYPHACAKFQPERVVGKEMRDSFIYSDRYFYIWLLLHMSLDRPQSEEVHSFSVLFAKRFSRKYGNIRNCHTCKDML